MKIGYARVSTDHQNLDLEMDALNKAACEQMFTNQGFSAKPQASSQRSPFIASGETGSQGVGLILE